MKFKHLFVYFYLRMVLESHIITVD